MGGLGAVMGFFIGQADLPKHFPSFGNTQMEVLSVLASTTLLATVVVTVITVQECPLDKDIDK
jgi:solute carrier family 45 protein 1/2/4